MGLTIFLIYWAIGICFVLISLTSGKIRSNFKKDFFAYICASLAVSLFYPVALIRAIIERSRNNETGRDI